MDDGLGLRERKKRQTRRALADAALRLFAEQGYEQTTIAQIAAAAEVSPRTFFSYFPTKEDVLFGDTDERIDLVREAIADTPPGSSATDVLHDAITRIFASPTGMFGADRATLVRLVLEHPELRAKALHRILAAHRELADWLRGAYPDRLPGTLADTAAGALLGGLIATALAGMLRDDPITQLHADLTRAADLIGAVLTRPDRQPHGDTGWSGPSSRRDE